MCAEHRQMCLVGHARSAPLNISADACTINRVHHTLSAWTDRARWAYLIAGPHLEAMCLFPSIATGRLSDTSCKPRRTGPKSMRSGSSRGVSYDPRAGCRVIRFGRDRASGCLLGLRFRRPRSLTGGCPISRPLDCSWSARSASGGTTIRSRSSRQRPTATRPSPMGWSMGICGRGRWGWCGGSFRGGCRSRRGQRRWIWLTRSARSTSVGPPMPFWPACRTRRGSGWFTMSRG